MLIANALCKQSERLKANFSVHGFFFWLALPTLSDQSQSDLPYCDSVPLIEFLALSALGLPFFSLVQRFVQALAIFRLYPKPSIGTRIAPVFVAQVAFMFRSYQEDACPTNWITVPFLGKTSSPVGQRKVGGVAERIVWRVHASAF